MDPVTEIQTGLAIYAAFKISEKQISKLLGPTSDYLGNSLKLWTEKGLKNISSIFQSAINKLGRKIDNNGGVPAKVLKIIINEGAFCEDALQAEYFGGILASSRSDISRDDRGVYFASLVSRMSSYQIRTHYILYHTLKNSFNGQEIPFENGIEMSMRRVSVYISADGYIKAMDFNQKEIEIIDSLIGHIFFGLQKENLVHTFYTELKESLRIGKDSTLDPGILFLPSPLGIELFLWAYGFNDLALSGFLKGDIIFESYNDIKINGYCKSDSDPNSWAYSKY